MGQQIKRLLTNTGEWAKHLHGSFRKRQFWKGERKAEVVVIKEGVKDYEEGFSEEDEFLIEEFQEKWEEDHQQRLMKKNKK